MIKIIITALITYFAISIDEIPILFMLYTKVGNKGRGKIITISFFIGTFILIALGFLGALVLGQIPKKWIIGLSGLVPLALGMKIIIKGEEEDEENQLSYAQKFHKLAIQVVMITIGLGADDLGVYLPLFTTVTGVEIIQMIIVFAFGTALLCYISYQLTRIEKLTRFIEKQERFIVGIIFTAVGILVMTDCGTISKIVGLLARRFT